MREIRITLTETEAWMLNDLLSMELTSLGFSDEEDAALSDVLEKLNTAMIKN